MSEKGERRERGEKRDHSVFRALLAKKKKKKTREAFAPFFKTMGEKKTSQKQPTTGPSPYLIAPAPPSDTQSAGDLSSSQPYWRDPNQVSLPFPPPDAAGPPGPPRQGVSPPVGGGEGTNGTEPSPASPPAPSNGTPPGNETAAPKDNGGDPRSTITRGAQLLLPAADPRRADPFAALALGVAGALLPPVLAAKAAELANAAAAKVFSKKARKKRKKPSKFCPLSPADRDLLRTATGAALGAGASALAESATALELSRCALTLKSTRPAAFQWVLFSGGRVNPCSIVLGRLLLFFLLFFLEKQTNKKTKTLNLFLLETNSFQNAFPKTKTGQVSQTITEAIVEGKCYVPPESTAATSAAAVGS